MKVLGVINGVFLLLIIVGSLIPPDPTDGVTAQQIIIDYPGMYIQQ